MRSCSASVYIFSGVVAVADVGSVIKVMARAAVERIHSQEELDALVLLLECADWRQVIADGMAAYNAMRQAQYDELVNTMTKCHRCAAPSRLGDLGDLGEGLMCQRCRDEVLEASKRICIICDEPYRARRSDEGNAICPTCYSPERMKEWRRVKAQNSRAVNVSTAATLTIADWLRTLDAFEWQCAYCSGPFECMEHFVPIELGGGTTRDNCVPACLSCNNTKGGYHPNLPTTGRNMPVGAMARVCEYLEGVRRG